MSHKVIAPLAVAIQANVPVLLVGGPGVGKSSAIMALANHLQMPYEIVIASLREPADFAGLPVVTEHGVTLAPPAWAVRLSKVDKGLLVLDEISTAAPAVQAAVLRVILDRVVGEAEIPNARMVAAMNPPEQAAGGWELSPPLSNRFCHLRWDVNVGDWIEGMLNDFPTPDFPIVPEGWEVGIKKTRLMIASFIQSKQTALYNCPTDDASAGKPWPSPRSWTMAATLSAACQAAHAGLDVELPLISGCVGDGNALEYINWRDALDLPDPEMLLKHPTTFECPERGDKTYTILASVASAVVSNMTKPRFLAAWHIFKVAADAGKKDLGAAAVRTLARASLEKGYMSDPEVRKAMTLNLAPYVAILKQAGLV